MSKICFAGDIMLGENIHHYRRGIPRIFKGKYDALIDKSVYDFINSSDTFLGNLECTLAPEPDYWDMGIKDSCYRAPVSALECFANISSQVVLNLANNHFSQHGIAASNFTTDELQKSNIRFTGVNNKPLSIHSDGFRLLIWGVSLIPEKNPSDIIFRSSPENLLDDLALPQKQQNERWIISIHWGHEYSTIPSSAEKSLSDKLHSLGFDIIMGHHPHVIQPWESNHSGLTIYSLGNFIFDQNFSSLTRHGLLMSIDSKTNCIESCLTKQNGYVVNAKPTSLAEISSYCKRHYSSNSALRMRILMKLELLLHLHQSNIATFVYFGRKLLKRMWRK